MKKTSLILSTLILLLLASACVKQEFDKPPINQIPVGEVYTIGDLITMLNTSGATQFNKDASVYAVVTMDETSGNIYKNAYIQDATGAINVRLKESGGLRVGDSIRVYLRKVILSTYNGMRQLDNVHNDSNIVILANQRYRKPDTVTIQQVLSGQYQAKLVYLKDVQFIAGDTARSWSESNTTTNRMLEDCNGRTIIVRTSNFANFASKNLPNGKGSLVAVAGVFNNTWQLYVRTLSEAKMDGARCGGGGGGSLTPVDKVDEAFTSVTTDVDINLSGWSNIAEAGTRKWQGKIFSGNGYAQASGYNSNLTSMVTWLITPPVKMDVAKILRFKTAKSFWAHGNNNPLTVLVSSNFDGTNIAAATWTPINARLATQTDADNAWIESGDIDLSMFIPEGKIAVAFKYIGSNTLSTSFRIDDVYIGTQGSGGGGGGGGNAGTIDNPFTVEEAIQKQNATPYVVGWVQGYIVGAVKAGVSSVTSSADIDWAAPFSSNTNVLIATNMNETDYTKCVVVNLPAGTPLRTQVNLLDNPSNFKKQLKVRGTLRTYFGIAGLRDSPGQIADFVLQGGGGGGGGGTSIFVENFDTNLGVFTAISVQGDQVWTWGNFDGGCAVMTGYVNPNRFPNEDWLISPAINLTATNNAILNVRQAANYVSNDWSLLQVMVSTNYTSGNPNDATWTELTIPNRPAGTNWTFVDSGNISLAAYGGQANVRIAFRYRSTASIASTWEISKVEVKN